MQYEEFEVAKRVSEASTVFARVPGEEGGRFPLTGRGDVNTYSLFAELFSEATGRQGRAGVIVPTGIATDATTAPFFAALIRQRRLASLLDFENAAPIFPSVHRSYKFSLLTTGQDMPSAEFAFYLHDTSQLADPARRFVLGPDELARINPNTLNAPLFRSRADAALTAEIYGRVPVLVGAGADSGNPWGISFMRMFDMATDSGLFRMAEQFAAEGLVQAGTDWINPPGISSRQPTLALAGGRDTASLQLDAAPTARQRYVPLYEAKMVHQFDHRWATYDGIDSRDATAAEHADPIFEPTPRY